MCYNCLHYSSCELVSINIVCFFLFYLFFFQAEDGIRDLVRSRGLGDVYKRQRQGCSEDAVAAEEVDLQLHRIAEPAEDVDVVPPLSLIHI